MSELEFVVKQNSENLDLEILSYMLNHAWRDVFQVSPDVLRGRFNTGNFFMFLYSEPTDADEEFLVSKGIYLEGNEKIPISVVETIGLMIIPTLLSL